MWGSAYSYVPLQNVPREIFMALLSGLQEGDMSLPQRLFILEYSFKVHTLVMFHVWDGVPSRLNA